MHIALEPDVTSVSRMLSPSNSAFRTSQPAEIILCSTCTTACTDLQGLSGKRSQNRGLLLLKSPVDRGVTLKYERKDEDCIVKKIIVMGSSNGSPPMTVAFLLCLCVQYSSICLHTSDLRRLLLLLACEVQSAVWVSSTEKVI